MAPARYGDMEKFVQELKAAGYDDVRLILTADGKFMRKKASILMMLAGSTLLGGKK